VRAVKDDWLSVSPEEVCPVCGHTSNCKVSQDGSAVWCGRVQSDRQNAGGQWLHRTNKETYPKRFSDKKYISPTKPKKQTRHFLDLASYEKKADGNKGNLRYWAERYSLPVASWLAVRAFASTESITIPEVSLDDPLRVCGLVARSRSTDKANRWKCGAGHSRGATIGKLPCGDGLACLLVEGGSDTATAIAMNCEAVGRHTRDAPLESLSLILCEIPPDHHVILIVENDHPKHDDCSAEDWIQHLFFCAVERAKLLANKLGRPVIVARPPSDIKDLNDWWKIETDSLGHLLCFDDRVIIGQLIVKELVDTGKEVPPSKSQIEKYKTEKFKELKESVYLSSEILRQNSIARGMGFDSDYEAEDSCSFYRSFSRRNEEKKMNEYLFGFLSCKSWKCPSCRERKLKPEWLIHLAEIFVGCDLIFRTHLTSDPLKVVKDYRSAKRQIERHKGNFAAIELQSYHRAIYSTVETKQNPKPFRIGSHQRHFDELLRHLRDDIAGVNASCGRPISTCRNWSQGEAPSIGDMQFKVERIAEIFCGMSKMLHLVELSCDEAESALSVMSRRNRGILEISDRYEYVAISRDDSTLVMTSRPIDGSKPYPAEYAIVPVLAAIRQAGFDHGDNWRLAVRTSPRWTPKPSKRWRPLDSSTSPAQARAAAHSAKVDPTDFASEPTSSFCDGVSVRFYDGQVDKEETFLARLNG